MMVENQSEDRILLAIMNAYFEADEEKFLHLCKENKATVLTCFADWTKVPETLRENEDASRAYVEVIIGVAQLMQQLGYDEPINQITGGSDNPIDRWQRKLSTAQSRAQMGEYEESNDILKTCQQEMDGAQGSIIDNLRPKVLGLLGSNCLYLCDFVHARHYTHLALEDCQRLGDHDGIRAYRENLDILLAIDASQSGSEAGADLLEIRSTIALAQDMTDQHLYDASDALLGELQQNLEASTDERITQYRAKVLGLRGTNAFKTENMDRAHRLTHAALEICIETGDFDGVRIYQANLETIVQAGEPTTS